MRFNILTVVLLSLAVADGFSISRGPRDKSISPREVATLGLDDSIIQAWPSSLDALAKSQLSREVEKNISAPPKSPPKGRSSAPKSPTHAEPATVPQPNRPRTPPKTVPGSSRPPPPRTNPGSSRGGSKAQISPPPGSYLHNSPAIRGAAVVGARKFLAVDVRQVGYILADGRFKISGGFPTDIYAKDDGSYPAGQVGSNKYPSGRYPRLSATEKAIGSDSLATCSAVMLISTKGALMVHLDQNYCNMFGNTMPKGADEGTKAGWEAFTQLKIKSKQFFDELKARGSQKFAVITILGPETKGNNQHAHKMPGELFHLDQAEIQKEIAIEKHLMVFEGHKFFVADFTGPTPIVKAGGEQIPIPIPN